MPAPPPPNLNKLSRPATRIAVLLGPAGGGISPTDEVDYLHALTIERSAGGRRLDTIVLDYDLDLRGERIVDLTAPIGYDREVEVVELDAQGQMVRSLGWGKIGIQPYSIQPGGEEIKYIVRIERYLFGTPLLKSPYWDEKATAFQDLGYDFVFNPEIDDKIQGNKSSHQNSAKDSCYVFIHPDAVRTAGATSYQGQFAEEWLLAEACHMLCWTANPDETYIRNPTLDELQDAFANVPEDALKNHKLSFGKYLPDALDELLEPFGCGWYLVHELDQPNQELLKPKLEFYRDGEGAVRKLYLQRPGEYRDLAKTNVETLAVQYSIADMANHITGQSSLIERESTFTLWPLWDPTEDTTDFDDLKTGTDYCKAKPHVGKKFGINTDGTYNGLRPQIPAVGTYLADVVKPLLGSETLPGPRPFYPCLSRVENDDGLKESRGRWVEWYNSDETKWEKVKWSFSVSEREGAIFFNEAPEELWDIIQDNPANLQLRITCTLRGDTRAYGIATRQASSPNGNDVRLCLNLEDKFHDRQVATSSIFYPNADADEEHNPTALQTYVEKVRDIDDCALVAATVTLEGIDHPEYEIGDVLSEVRGRNLSLDANSPASGFPRRLQIVGMSYDLQNFTTTLHLETIESKEPEV